MGKKNKTVHPVVDVGPWEAKDHRCSSSKSFSDQCGDRSWIIKLLNTMDKTTHKINCWSRSWCNWFTVVLPQSNAVMQNNNNKLHSAVFSSSENYKVTPLWICSPRVSPRQRTVCVTGPPCKGQAPFDKLPVCFCFELWKQTCSGPLCGECSVLFFFSFSFLKHLKS